ncbi:MAG: hypothetical protein Q9190_001606 [Brigantiaea leucoxantha]
MKGRPLEAVACSSDASSQKPVIAWPGNTWFIDYTPGLDYMDTNGENCSQREQGHADAQSPKSHPLSCSSTPQNTKCYPISKHQAPLEETDLELQDTDSYKNRPVRQAPEQQILSTGARSISLRWPEGMQHAVFFTDEACHSVGSGRPEYTWHVQRIDQQAVQCESPPAGLFKSVEFMRQHEYDTFSRRMRGQVDGFKKARWRDLL